MGDRFEDYVGEAPAAAVKGDTGFEGYDAATSGTAPQGGAAFYRAQAQDQAQLQAKAHQAAARSHEADLRLQCVRLAADTVAPHDVVRYAGELVAYVLGQDRQKA